MVIAENNKSLIVEKFEIDQSTRPEINATARWRLVGADAVDNFDSSAEDVNLSLLVFVPKTGVDYMCTDPDSSSPSTSMLS